MSLLGCSGPSVAIGTGKTRERNVLDTRSGSTGALRFGRWSDGGRTITARRAPPASEPENAEPFRDPRTSRTMRTIRTVVTPPAVGGGVEVHPVDDAFERRVGGRLLGLIVSGTGIETAGLQIVTDPKCWVHRPQMLPHVAHDGFDRLHSRRFPVGRLSHGIAAGQRRNDAPSRSTRWEAA